MKRTKYDKEIKELEEQQGVIGKRLSNLRLSRAESLCPYKIGDIITSKNGKRRAKISKITASTYSDYKLWGYWMKKDGSIGTQYRELYWFEWE